MAKEQLDALLETTSDAERILILTHNDPDPDAIGSAVALRHLLVNLQNVPVEIAYQGIIGRAENKMLVRYLNYPLHLLSRDELKSPVSIALVDTQPGAGNSPVRQNREVTVVIDHHPWHTDTHAARFSEVRAGIGATSTILTEYLQAASIEIPTQIATALFYGIKTDTLGLSRSGAADDVRAYSFLVQRIDSQALFEIEQAQVPADYFKGLVETLQATRVYEDVLFAYIGRMEYPDLAAEIADWLLRLEGVRWVVCVGAYQQNLNVAVRSRHRRGGAGKLALSVIGDQGTAGGHGITAGGQVRLDGRDPEEVARQVNRAVLSYFGIPPDEDGRSILREEEA